MHQHLTITSVTLPGMKDKGTGDGKRCKHFSLPLLGVGSNLKGNFQNRVYFNTVEAFY